MMDTVMMQSGGIMVLITDPKTAGVVTRLRRVENTMSFAFFFAGQIDASDFG